MHHTVWKKKQFQRNTVKNTCEKDGGYGTRGSFITASEDPTLLPNEDYQQELRGVFGICLSVPTKYPLGQGNANKIPSSVKIKGIWDQKKRAQS